LWEPTGYIGIANKEILHAIVAALRHRGGPTNFVQLPSEGTELGHSKAKNLAEIRASKELYDEPDIDINPNFNLTGAQLAHMIQALAYKGIREMKTPHDRQKTTQMLAIT
jgi:hypothetical protein